MSSEHRGRNPQLNIRMALSMLEVSIACPFTVNQCAAKHHSHSMRQHVHTLYFAYSIHVHTIHTAYNVYPKSFCIVSRLGLAWRGFRSAALLGAKGLHHFYTLMFLTP